MMGLCRLQRCVAAMHRKSCCTYRCTSHAASRRSRVAAVALEEVADAPVPTRPAVPFRAALDFKFVLDNVDMLKKNAVDRLSKADPEQVAVLYRQFVDLTIQSNDLRNERNENSKLMKGKLDQQARAQLIERGQKLKEELTILEQSLSAVENALQYEGQRLPNMTHPQVPIGAEEEAAVLRVNGAQAEFQFQPRNHVDIMEELDLVDFDTASEVTGSKFYYLRNAAALLELGLVNMAMQRAAAKGFTPIMTPDLVRESVLEKCGFQPRMSNTQTYSVVDSDLCLTGTAEVPLGGAYMDKVIDEKDLPIRMAAFGHCFRTEAGAGGMAGKGLYRVHQFSKVEMFVICTPEQSDALHDELIAIEEEMFRELGLHFKVLDMPSGDLGSPAYRKFDVEAWMPGLQRYGEISSASNCTDYQARRLNIRYRPSGAGKAESDAAASPTAKKQKKAGPTAFCHTLNATACAVPRMIIAIIENNQQADGSVLVPDVLQPYLGGLKAITKR